jgi:serine/threonine protein kinase/tetratricopeptide (TPR) repeat protein
VHSAPPEISTCPTCGGALDETSGGGLGCMVCLLRVGIGGDDPAAAGLQDATPNPFGGEQRFGVYEIERHRDGSPYELGRGAMGVTYRAIDTALQREVALKIIMISLAGRSAEARERFMREARAAAALRHENIATVFQFGIREDTGQCFYAMELIEGETLEKRVHRAGPLGVRATIDIARQVTSALAAAEKRGLIHRDLKPANLMLVSPDSDTSGTGRNDEKLVVKIIDFGLAKALNAQSDRMSLTRGGFVGTPAFASPEQFEQSALDVRSDIYSLGITLWFALTGKTPFRGPSVEEIHRAQQLDALPIEQLKAARVPSRLRSLLESMLALEPAARPGTHDLAARLEHCSAQANPGGFRGTRVALVMAFVLILSASAFFPRLRDSLRTQNSASNPAVPEKSIAVLPFENLSRDPDSAFFADGVQDEILSDLARIADLKVIGRTSVMQYKSGTARDLRKIGQELRVAHLVEGSVQRSGNRVRVNAQLVDARTDRRLWGQTYDRDLADVFVIQSEIAKVIADELHAKLSPTEAVEIERPTTSDITAFDLYARANSLLLTVSDSSTERVDLLQAADLLQQAVARDRWFFEAYCQLAWAHDQLYFFGFDHTPARLELADAAVRAAGRLRPHAGETHFARARTLYCGYLDYDGALAELKAARESLPNDPQIFQLTAYVQGRQGRWEESTENLEHALDLDPRNTFTLQQLAGQYMFLRLYAEAKPLLSLVLAIEPNRVNTKVMFASVDFHWKADTRPFHQMIDSIRATNPAATPTIAEAWLICSLAERDAAAAKDALMAAGENPINLGGDVYFNRAFIAGLIARMAKDDDNARLAFTAARAEQEKSIQAQPNFGPAFCVLGLIDAALGRKEEALREGRRAIELLPVEKDAYRGNSMIKYLAMIAAWAGDKDLACEQLAIAIRSPSDFGYGELKLLPWWDPLRGDPRFEKIVASLAPNG